jgi:hypothetical protein
MTCLPVLHTILHLPHLSGNAAMAVMAWAGTVGGGEFEDGFVAVCRHDGQRMHGIELFDLDDYGAAESALRNCTSPRDARPGRTRRRVRGNHPRAGDREARASSRRIDTAATRRWSASDQRGPRATGTRSQRIADDFGRSTGV